MQRVCFFHAGCPDGLGAAWAVRQFWGPDAHYIPRGHDDRCDPDDYKGALVAFVDIAPRNDELRELADRAQQVVVLDHHISSQERFEAEPALGDSLRADGHQVQFDMSHSGAVLAWLHFSEGAPAPDLLRYVQDQDLWSWALDRSHEVNAAIGSYPLTFAAWDDLARRPIEELMREGEPLIREQRVAVERALEHAGPLRIGERSVEGVNAREHRASIGHALAERERFGQPWGCVYRIERDRVMATLYSIGAFDVSKIAGEFGGGGHKNAAGFSVPLARWASEFA